MNGLFRQMVVVNIVINLIMPCNQLIDTIMTGQAYGAEALQVYALFLPVSSFLIAASCLFSKGTQITCSHFMGRGKIREAEQVLCTAAYIAAVASIAIGVLVFVFAGELSLLLGASADVPGQIRDMSGYLRGYAPGIPEIFLLDVLMCVLMLEGDENVLIYASVSMLITNALGNVANIFVFKMGITGMALATSFSNIVAFIYMLIYFLNKSKMFHLSIKSFRPYYVLEIIKNGTPSLTYFGSLVIRSAIMNALVLSGMDRGVLVSILVANNFAVVTDVLISGWGEAILLLEGVLYGEKDESGAKSLLTGAAISGAVVMCLITVLTFFFRVPISRLFIKADEAVYITMAARALSITALCLVPDILQCILKKYVQAIGCPRYTTVTNILTNVVYCCGFAWILTRIMGSDGLFVSYTVCYTMALVSNFVFMMLVSPKKYDISKDDFLTFNINSLEEGMEASEKVYRYCMDKGMEKRKSTYLSLFVEEMVKNTVVHGFVPGHRNSMIVKLIRSGETTKLSIKDNCRHFDPSHYYEKVCEGTAPDSGFGIKMIMKLSKNVVYTSSFNLNNLFVEV